MPTSGLTAYGLSIFFVAGAIALALAVGAGAFGAHGLKAMLTPELLANWETAARYHAYHGLGLFAVAYALDRAAGRPAGWLVAAGWPMSKGA